MFLEKTAFVTDGTNSAEIVLNEKNVICVDEYEHWVAISTFNDKPIILVGEYDDTGEIVEKPIIGMYLVDTILNSDTAPFFTIIM